MEPSGSFEMDGTLEFQYNICTCGAKLDETRNPKQRKFQYNICTCGAKKYKCAVASSTGFQYNICTCGAFIINQTKASSSYFNTTFVHVEPKIICDGEV